MVVELLDTSILPAHLKAIQAVVDAYELGAVIAQSNLEPGSLDCWFEFEGLLLTLDDEGDGGELTVEPENDHIPPGLARGQVLRWKVLLFAVYRHLVDGFRVSLSWSGRGTALRYLLR